MIQVTGPDWPTTRSLRDALATAPEVGNLAWGASPCGKLEAFLRMRAAGIRVPTWTTSMDEANQWHSWGLPVWGRKIRHTKGLDITRFNERTRDGGRRWVSRDFWVQVLPSTREWRIHVWNGRAFRTGVKQPLPTATQTPHPIRSDRLGWQLCYSQAALDAALPDRTLLRHLAKDAVAAIRATGGAVDILEGPHGELTVLEVNTAPALGENTLAAWVEEIRRSFQPRRARGVTA